jgi:hypothetical protein
MKSEASCLLQVLAQMLAPASATPTPQRLELEAAMHALQQAISDAEKQERATHDQA